MTFPAASSRILYRIAHAMQDWTMDRGLSERMDGLSLLWSSFSLSGSAKEFGSPEAGAEGAECTAEG